MADNENDSTKAPWYTLALRWAVSISGVVFLSVLSYRLATLRAEPVTVTEAVSVLLAVFSIALAIWLNWQTHQVTVRFYESVLELMRQMTGKVAGFEAQAGRLSMDEVHSLLARFLEAQTNREQLRAESEKKPDDAELKVKLGEAEATFRQSNEQLRQRLEEFKEAQAIANRKLPFAAVPGSIAEILKHYASGDDPTGSGSGS